MAYECADVISQAKDRLNHALHFGLPVKDYQCFGELEDHIAESYDFVCISECRHCGKLNTTIAQEEDGLIMPMSAGRGPECKAERCGDKIAAITYGYFKLVLKKKENPAPQNNSCSVSLPPETEIENSPVPAQRYGQMKSDHRQNLQKSLTAPIKRSDGMRRRKLPAPRQSRQILKPSRMPDLQP